MTRVFTDDRGVTYRANIKEFRSRMATERVFKTLKKYGRGYFVNDWSDEFSVPKLALLAKCGRAFVHQTIQRFNIDLTLSKDEIPPKPVVEKKDRIVTFEDDKGKCYEFKLSKRVARKEEYLRRFFRALKENGRDFFCSKRNGGQISSTKIARAADIPVPVAHEFLKKIGLKDYKKGH